MTSELHYLMKKIKTGDLVRPKILRDVESHIERVLYANKKQAPTFSSRGKTRIWPVDQIALVIGNDERKIGSSIILKIKVLLDGEQWWVNEHEVEVVSEQST